MSEWEWYLEPDTLRVFIHLLIKANHKPKNWKGTIVNTGELITGRKVLALELRMGERRVRTALTRLKETNEVTIKTTNKYSLIKLNKWEKYQSLDQQNVQQETNKRPTRDQQLTTNKNEKNEKNVEECKEIKIAIPTPRDVAEEFFSNSEKRQTIIEWMIGKGIPQNVASQEVEKFVSYWTEPTLSGKRVRWEMERTFDVQRRFVTWIRNIQKFSQSKSNEPKGIRI